MRRSGDFTRTFRSGVRAGRPALVLHVLPPSTVSEPDPGPTPAGSTQVGLVVSKAVGGAVVRTAVKRRLRHQVASRLDSFPAGSQVVVRALPPSAGASSAELGSELDRAMDRVLSRIGVRS